VRYVVLGIVIALVGAGCGRDYDARPQPADPRGIEFRPSPSPFTLVETGYVRAMVPDEWRTRPTSGHELREGFVASPRPAAWRAMNGSSVGMVAGWVDATTVGVPSDFYYLAARGPLLSGLTGSARCRAERSRVFADHLPSFAHGTAASNGDYIARGEGVCTHGGRATRWAYFVAAPGFGPTRAIGIARSGLYVVLAVTQKAPGAHELLDHLLDHTRFGDARIADFVRAVRGGVTVA
jgi:hypothetical protein